MSRTFIENAGPYSPTQSYSVGDAVTIGGLAYVSASYPNLGNPVTDAAHWTPFGSVDPTILALLAREPVVYLGGSGGGSKATPQLTWPTPAPITYGATLTAAQLNATANALGTFAYSPALGTQLAAGSHTLSVTFTPADATVYVPVTATVALTVAQATPAIAWPPPPSLFHLNALSATQLNASSSVPGTFSYAPPSGTTLPSGTATLSATFTPTDTANYTSITVTRALTVAAAVAAPSFVQGAAAPIPGTSTAPVVFTLAAPPTVGNLLTAFICYNDSFEDYDYLLPDPTWTLTLGGRTGSPAAGGSNRIAIFTHFVTPADGLTFTFYPTTGTNSGMGLMMIETANTGQPQIGLAYAGQSNSQTTPALTPAASGSLAFALDYNAYTYPLPAGWTALPGATFGLAQLNAATPDAATPVSCSFGGYSPANAVAGLLLYPPAFLCAAPIASPAAGSTAAATETVTLTCATPGATIFYTLDGSLPTASSAVYSGPFTFDRTTQLGVLATAPGYAPSGAAFYTFVVAAGTILGVGLDGNLNGYIPFASDILHTDISAAPVDPNSAATLANLRVSGYTNVSPDDGIGYNVVDSTPGHPWTTPLTPVGLNVSPADISYGGDYPTLAPIPANLYIEGQPPAGTITGDNHSIPFDRGAEALFEMWRTTDAPTSASRPTQVAASNLSIFDLTLPDTLQRPFTYTSADAAGCSVFEGLPRFDEVMAAIADGSMCLKHAIRMTAAGGFFHGVSQGSDCYAYIQLPATHGSNPHPLAIADPTVCYYGMRLRLEAAFSVSGYSLVNQVLFNTMKRFGFFMADIGFTFSWNIARDPRWDQTDLRALVIPSTHLEVVQKGTPAAIPVSGPPAANVLYSEANYPHGTPPTITSFTSSAATIALGGSVTLTATMLNASYGFVDLAGFVRSGHPIAYTPTARGTFTLTLTAQSPFLANDDQTGDGTRVTAQLTVTVT